MVNAYAFKATKPRDMKRASDPIGPKNDTTLRRVVHGVLDLGGVAVAAWGSHCSAERELQVCELIGRPLECLGRTKHGRPKHPLFLRADTSREPFWSPS